MSFRAIADFAGSFMFNFSWWIQIPIYIIAGIGLQVWRPLFLGEKITVLQKLKSAKLQITPEHKGIVSEQEMKEGFNLILEKIVKEKGEDWFESVSAEEIEKVIIAYAGQVGREYFEKKAREKMVNIIAEGITGLKKK